MKRATTIKQTDVILSVGILALVLLAAMAVAVTGTTDEFIAWAWERHHNVLSWYIRPFFLLPFCYFAYRRSLFGITLTLVALATSMSWFPALETTSPAVTEMLASEEEYLTADWTLWKVFIALLDEADLGHDTTGRLPEISVPTLIIGGSEDPFFSESLLRETAGKIPDAELRVYEDVGHGVPKERKRRYEDDALAFLSERRISI